MVELNIEADNIFLSLDTAIPCGLIINELISNALKHAFPDKKHGTINIRLYYTNEHEIQLTISDNGVGIPAEIDYHSTRSLGLNIVTTLVRQLKGSIELDRSCGTEFSIRFKR